MKKIVSIILLIVFLTSILPLQAIALDTQGTVDKSFKSGKNENILFSKLKKALTILDEDIPKKERERELLPPANISTEVNLNGVDTADLYFGNSVYYHTLKKSGLLDLLGKGQDEITQKGSVIKKGQMASKQENDQEKLPNINAPIWEKEDENMGKEFDSINLDIIEVSNGDKEENPESNIKTEEIEESIDNSHAVQNNQELLGILEDNQKKDKLNSRKIPEAKVNFKTNRFIIKYLDGEEEQGKQEVKEYFKETFVYRELSKKREVLIARKGISLNDLISNLNKKKAGEYIESIQPDYKLLLSSNDEYYNLQWGIENKVTIGDNDYRIDSNAVPAWDTTLGEGVIVAVIDSGMDIAHEDLAQNIWINTGEIDGNNIDDDGNGFIDDINGWNFIDDNKQIEASSQELHATNLAGIIAAVKDNQVGITGVAPAIKIMPIKVFNNGSAYTSDIIEAIKYAEIMGAKVVNCSWGSYGENPALEEVMRNSNMIFVCAAGNGGKDLEDNYVSPASFSGHNIITVASINKNGVLSSFSNFGVRVVDLAAPGEEIITTAPQNSYVSANGSSMAAAFVTGEVAILFSNQQNISNEELVEKIIISCEHYSSLLGKVSSGNKINIANALAGISPKSDEIIEIPEEENFNQIEDLTGESELIQLYSEGTTQKSWYNTLVGPSATNGVEELKYSAWNNYEEIVSPQTGDLILKQTDISLPGRNGLDLEIGRLFQSSQAIFGDRKLYGDGATSYNDYSTYLINRYGLGTGWSFNFPSVQVEEDEGIKELYYHTGSGPVYHVKFGVNSSNLECYDTKDAIFDNDSTFSNGEMTSQYSFTIANKTKQFFASDGRLLGIKDRFGNTITFKHTNLPVANYAPNFNFKSNKGWTTENNNYSYDTTIGKDDESSLRFNCISSTNGTSYSNYIPVAPNKQYNLSGYIKSMLSSGTAGLTYEEYTRYYTNNGSGSITLAPNNGDWERVSLDFTTSSGTEYVRIVFKNANAAGSSYLDKVRFDRSWPLISEIIDSIGRKITFEYIDTLYEEESPSSPDAGQINITIQAPAPHTESVNFTYTRGRAIVNYNWPDWQEERRYPFLYMFDNGEDTGKNFYIYDASMEENFSFTSKTSSGAYQRSKRPLLKEVWLRNSKIKYIYSKVGKHMGENGFYETYRITKRSEHEETDTGYSSIKNNEQSYSYWGIYPNNGTYFQDETGYMYDNNWPYNLFKDREYSFTSKMTQTNGLIIEQAYKGKYHHATTKYHSNGEKEIITYEEYDSRFPDQPTKLKRELVTGDGTKVLYKGFSYNTWGGLESETRELTLEQWNNATTKTQNTFNYTYDSTYKALKTKKYYQDSGNQLTETINYDSLGRVSSTQNVKGGITERYYENSSYPGSMTKEIVRSLDGRDSITSFDYADSYGAFPTTITKYYTEDGQNKISSSHQTYEYIFGNLLETREDSSGYEKTNIYDNYGRLIKATYPATKGIDGNFIVEDNYEYKDVGINKGSYYNYAFCVHHFKTKKIDNDEPIVIADNKLYYNDHGKLIRSQYFDFDKNTYISTGNEYNSYGQLSSIRNAKGNSSYYYFDEWNRLVKVTDSQNNSQLINYDRYNQTKTVSFKSAGGIEENHFMESYDQWGRTVSRKGFPDGINGPTVIEEKYEYDLVGNIISIIDPESNITQFQYDYLDRLTKVINPLGEEIDYNYDRLGNLASIKQYSDNKIFETTKLYDERGLLISSTPSSSRPTTYKYNSIGLPVQITDALGRVSTMKYDQSARLVEASVNQDKIRYYYHPLGGIEKYETLKGSQLEDTLTYSYNSIGQVTERKNGSFGVAFEYDTLGNQTKVTDPFGYSVNYDYDSLNRINTITADGKSFSYEYYADGMIKAVNYPNSIRTEYTYDNINRLKTLTNKKNTVELSKYSYEYDKNGNIVAITESGFGTSYYKYDALNRLTMIDRANGERISYKYDSRGNRTYVSTNNANNPTAIPAEYKYDSYNNLSSYSANGDSYSYKYDAVGLRTKKIGPNNTTTNYYYDDNGLVISESTGSEPNQPSAQNIWGHRLLARKVNAQYYYYLYNGHSDVVQVVSESGNIVNRYRYDEWGNILEKQEAFYNPIRYAGEYYDEESGLYYLRARYYDPTVGRFITKDRYEGDISNPLTINLYTYCVNNPLIYVDPSGYFAVGLRAEINKLRDRGINASVDWDYDARIATATVNGITKYYRPDQFAPNGADGGLRIANGHIMMDMTRFFADFGVLAPSLVDYVANHPEETGVCRPTKDIYFIGVPIAAAGLHAAGAGAAVETSMNWIAVNQARSAIAGGAGKGLLGQAARGRIPFCVNGNNYH